MKKKIDLSRGPVLTQNLVSGDELEFGNWRLIVTRIDPEAGEQSVELELAHPPELPKTGFYVTGPFSEEATPMFAKISDLELSFRVTKVTESGCDLLVWLGR